MVWRNLDFVLAQGEKPAHWSLCKYKLGPVNRLVYKKVSLSVDQRSINNQLKWSLVSVFRAEASLQSGFRKWPGRPGGRWRRWARENLHPPEPSSSGRRSRRHCGHIRSEHAQFHRVSRVPQCTALSEHGAEQAEAGDQQVDVNVRQGSFALFSSEPLSIILPVVLLEVPNYNLRQQLSVSGLLQVSLRAF